MTSLKITATIALFTFSVVKATGRGQGQCQGQGLLNGEAFNFRGLIFFLNMARISRGVHFFLH